MDEDRIEDIAAYMEALEKEYEARAEKLSAEERIKFNDMWKNTREEFDAMGDWTEASWKEFTAKAEQRWLELKN